MEKYTLFYDGIYSNWYITKFSDENGLIFNCSEQYMMYHKAMTFNDTDTAEKIMSAKTPREQKTLGRQVKNFKSDIWDAKSKDVVYKGCYFKFNQNPHLMSGLLSTKETTLVECAGTNDMLWGCGWFENQQEASQREKWTGKNWLGETLTRLREDIINGSVKI